MSGQQRLTPVVAEAAFRNEHLTSLIIEAAELLTEFTPFQYCIAFKIDRHNFFPAYFYIFERTMEGGRNLEDIDPATIALLPHDCIEDEIPINEELFANLRISLKFLRDITATNYAQDFSFDLEGKYFGLDQDVITFTVLGAYVELIKEEFDNHVARFP